MATPVSILLCVIAISVLLLLAVFGNTLVIICVAMYRKLRTVTNILICNLAVSDILLAGFVLPQKLHDMFHEEDFYEGELLCKVVNFSPIFIITSSIYTLVCVSFERKRAITANLEPQMTFNKLKILIPVTWLFALAVSFPTLLEYSVNTIQVNHGNGTKDQLSCGSQKMSRSFSLANAIFVTTVSYSIPVVMMFKNYLNVAVFVLRQSRQIRDMTRVNSRDAANLHRFRTRLKLVKLLVVVAVIFAVSWLPFFIMLLYAKVTGNDASENATGFVNIVIVALAAFSTAYNIVLYVVFNPSFKRAIKDLLLCRKSTALQEKHRSDGITLHTMAYPFEE